VSLVPAPRPTRPNEQWCMDFMSDRLDDGRRIRILTVEDVFSDTSTSTARHSRVTDRRRPTPQGPKRSSFSWQVRTSSGLLD